MIQAFTKNVIGKDYVCSDIHGHFSILENALASVGFDERRDRLFSLGDLIDRGDESCLALEWLARPWFFAIQGNHERMLINTVHSQSEVTRQQWMMWGGDWAEDMSYQDLQPFYDVFAKLPIAIEIELPDEKRVGLVHAELTDTCDWRHIKELLQSLSPMDVEHNLEVGNMLWFKNQPYLSAERREKVQPVMNIDHVFHGHTIVEDYLTITNRTFMDLGVYKTGRIGLICPSMIVGGNG